jgi:lactate dehydrogenase-like 2-hydroxyacid dehydrogenase
MAVVVSILDKFHPAIKAAIEQSAPADWTLRFIDQNSLAARAAVFRDADVALLAPDNTVITSHLAGATLDNFAGMRVRAVENVKTVLRGESPPAADMAVALLQRASEKAGTP